MELFSDKIISKIPEDFKQVDLITAFNVFAHSDDMNGMINGVKKLLRERNSIKAVDIKPKEFWFQEFENVENYFSLDMKDIGNCRKVTKNIDYVFNMACNMGGMGFIENNKAECMLSVLINTNLLRACLINSINK